jgi:hypothetical protein
MDEKRVYDLIVELRGRGVKLTLQEDKVKAAPLSAIPVHLCEEVRRRKRELVEWLRAEMLVRPPEWGEAKQAVEALQQSSDKLRELIRQRAKSLGWPRARLAPWAWIGAGEPNWEIFLTCPSHSPKTLWEAYEALNAEAAYRLLFPDPTLEPVET